jgi:hypothetical protein
VERLTASGEVMLVCCVVGAIRTDVDTSASACDGGGLRVRQLDRVVTGLCVGRKVCRGRDKFIHDRFSSVIDRSPDGLGRDHRVAQLRRCGCGISHRPASLLPGARPEAGFRVIVRLALGWEIHVLRTPRLFADGRCKMENINGKSRASFRGMLLCATIGLAVSVSPCDAQESPQTKEQFLLRQEQLRLLERRRAEEAEARETRKKMQGLPFGAPPPRAPSRPFLCDSAVPEVCLDIYRRMERFR